ncbi:sensor domain-containing diguanylate cyclase [Geoalkalibacter subterraneus]|uniref:diguanylate cyclase n=1 Tax=Geoalkalibacter subterraneus TaxID=483547 RepID=A0A0B5FTM3_9BACT|nr:GGDEF domain-containing protein [Geoalkalibacter subterraneus]AJF07515.1 hypothetical protein GSUB_14495 [Geoalkalibacter subterraneus]
MTDTILNHIFSAESLPTLPAVAAKVLTLSAGEETDLRELSRVISQDVSLSSKILRVANSPLYGFSTPVGTINKAVSVLGTNSVRSLVLSFSLIDLGERGRSQGFNYTRFWERSLATAVAARQLIMRCDASCAEEAFIAGLLGNLGEMLLELSFPERMREVDLRVEVHGLQRVEVERTLVGVDHAEVGAEAARRWRLPPQIAQPVRYHHDPPRAVDDPNMDRLIRVCHLAAVLAEVFFAADPRPYEEQFQRRAEELLDFNAQACRELSAGIHDEVNEAAGYFGLNLHLERSIEEILQEANQRLGEINLAYEQSNRKLLRTNRDLLDKTTSLERLAHLDGLTEVYNRRFMQTFLCSEHSRATRLDNSLALILADVDDFKALNDCLGHVAGDQALREICRVCRKVVRDYDLIARYGGEEFAFVLPETTLEEAEGLAERLRHSIAEHKFCFDGNFRQITLSLGVTAIRPASDRLGVDCLLRCADQALLKAKSGGKNRVVILSGPEQQALCSPLEPCR